MMPSGRIPVVSKRIRYGVVVIVAVVILLLSIQEPTGTGVYYGPFGVIRRDKWSHAIGYAILTATIAYAFVAPVSPISTDHRRRLAFSVCLAVVFGVCVELIQWPIPYRTASEMDAFADFIGSCLVAVVWWVGMRMGAVRFGRSGSDDVSG